MAFINERKQTRPMESQTERGMFDVVPERAGFIDLRPLEDDKTVLKNPHKGPPRRTESSISKWK